MRQEMFTPDEDAISIELGRLSANDHYWLRKYPWWFAIRCNMSFERATAALASVLEKQKHIYFDRPRNQ